MYYIVTVPMVQESRLLYPVSSVYGEILIHVDTNTTAGRLMLPCVLLQ